MNNDVTQSNIHSSKVFTEADMKNDPTAPTEIHQEKPSNYQAELVKATDKIANQSKIIACLITIIPVSLFCCGFISYMVGSDFSNDPQPKPAIPPPNNQPTAPKKALHKPGILFARNQSVISLSHRQAARSSTPYFEDVEDGQYDLIWHQRSKPFESMPNTIIIGALKKPDNDDTTIICWEFTQDPPADLKTIAISNANLKINP